MGKKARPEKLQKQREKQEKLSGLDEKQRKDFRLAAAVGLVVLTLCEPDVLPRV